jgi:hypothetical protein
MFVLPNTASNRPAAKSSGGRLMPDRYARYLNKGKEGESE